MWSFIFHYSPLPLVTLQYRYQAGLGGRYRHRYGLELTYRLHRPLAQQLDPQAVVTYRTLQHLQFDRFYRDTLPVMQVLSNQKGQRPSRPVIQPSPPNPLPQNQPPLPKLKSLAATAAAAARARQQRLNIKGDYW